MLSNHLVKNSRRLNRKKIILWVIVALYTASLPHVILAYQAIVQHFPPPTAGRIPLGIIAVLAAAYSVICIRRKAALRCSMILAVSTVIVFLIVNFEENANKYIHTPEYIIMIWLLYLALAVDYRGSGILLLVFLCALMLGVVDEILQGIHPQRTYGWKDMIIDAASSFIGILSVMGLKPSARKNWTWCRDLKHFKGALGVFLFGAAASVPMCIHLFDVQNLKSFFNAYPRWLLTGNGFFIAACVAVIIFYWRRGQGYDKAAPEIGQIAPDSHTTARLWIMCPLAILLCMHALVVWVALTGINFR
ncbi:MAG: VanZ family protein [Desulfobacterales bacterium]|nr:MAG: VanZ family protein [Desulfobacterales bacterium]